MEVKVRSKKTDKSVDRSAIMFPAGKHRLRPMLTGRDVFADFFVGNHVVISSQSC